MGRHQSNSKAWKQLKEFQSKFKKSSFFYKSKLNTVFCYVKNATPHGKGTLVEVKNKKSLSQSRNNELVNER